MKIDRPGPVVCFGEAMLRLSTAPGQKLANAHGLVTHVGGAEANVGALLAQLGRPVEMVTVLPRSPLGDWCEAELRRVGLGTRGIARMDGRLGLYFLEGAAAGGRILYDREDSAFARSANAFDWAATARTAAWFHLSGINLALGGKPAESALAAMEAMSAAGVAISFDVNHRASLWEGRSDEDLARVRKAMSLADVLFASPQDIGRVLGEDADPFAEFDGLNLIASTKRQVADQQLAVRLQTREAIHETDPAPLGQIVDRIGSGDAFAGAVIDAALNGLSLDECARFGSTLR